MRPLILLLIVLGQTGCLLAPSRPGGSGDDGGDDDGGVDCVPADAVLGVSVAAALDRPDRDTLVRAAQAAGGWHLYLYPSTTKNSRCPERMFPLGNDIASVDAIEPTIVTGADPDLLVLVSFTDGGSAVIDVRSAGGTLSEVGRVTATGYRPTPIGTSTRPDSPGFVALRGSELWFGGGQQGIAFANVLVGFSGTAQVLSTVADDGWYHAAAARTQHGAMDFVLFGALASYEANAATSFIDTTLVLDYGTCSGPPSCQARLASTLTSRGPVDTADAFTVDRRDGTLLTIASMAGGFVADAHAPMDRGAGEVIDAAVGELAGDTKTDVAMLWGFASGARELIVYDGMLTNINAAVASKRTFAAEIDRVEVLRTGTTSHILVLSDDPRREPESCLVLTGVTLEDCP